MDNTNILLAADILFNHRLNKTGLKNLPNKCIPQDASEAYKIQNELKILSAQTSVVFLVKHQKN